MLGSRRGVSRIGLGLAVFVTGIVIWQAAGSSAQAQTTATSEPQAKTLILNDFETDADVKALLIQGSGSVALTDQDAGHGQKALEVTWNPEEGPTFIHLVKPLEDWSAYDALQLDVFNSGDAPVPATVGVSDKAWQAKPDYWNRYNGSAVFAPGKTTWTIPVHGMFRGESGHRNRDIARDIDADSIVKVYFGFGDKGVKGKLVIDNLRLIKAAPPKGVWAFDLGPASQAVELGWTGVSPKTRYDAKVGYGFIAEVPEAAAHDTTFGPALIRDDVDGSFAPFRVDLAAGKYKVMVIYENSGFWGGEQAQATHRVIQALGQVAWQEDRPDGPLHALYRFENVEPLGDVWDTYMASELAHPVVFDATVDKDHLTLAFSATGILGSRISTIAIYKADDAQAANWVKEQMDAVADEFRRMALCLDKPAAKFEVSEAWQKLGMVAWPTRIEDDIKPASTPPAKSPEPEAVTVSRLAVQGEYEPLCLAIRPTKDLGTCQIRLEGSVPDIDAQVGVVWYGMMRSAGAISYHVMPHSLRPQSSVNLPKDVTREIVVTCHVGENAKTGEASWTLVLADASGKDLLRVPLKLSVHAVKLDRQTDFLMGYYGMNPPPIVPKDRWPALIDKSMRLLQQHGMNALGGGANFYLKGFKDGKPEIDFADMDAFVTLAQEYGFTRAVDSYSGANLKGINDGYQIGKTGKGWAEKTGLSYEEVLMRAWKSVDEHARKVGWPLIYVVLCDETRHRADAEPELEFMTLMSKVSKAFPKTLRTDGAYSVSFNTRPESKDDMLYWHQRYFETLDASTLNVHDESVLAEAAKLGKEVHIYNQGLSRYSFGLYQWSEYRKGVKARWQWHLNDMYGYQFFDLDGWTNDEMMIFYGRNAIYPAVAFERCREGAEDFYLYQMLWNLIEKGSGEPAAREKAKALLEDAVTKLKVNQCQTPEWFDADAMKAQAVEAIESLTSGK